jgi:hypothetical protein
MVRGCFSAASLKLQRPPHWSLVSGTEITKPRHQILSKEILGFQAHSEVGQYETPLYNGHRTHAGLGGRTPDSSAGPGLVHANVSSYRWQVHCRGLYQTPIAA